jgi:hypothetical protein
VAIREIQVPTPFAHPYHWQLDMLLAVLLEQAGFTKNRYNKGR